MFSSEHPQKNALFDFYSPLGPHYRGLLSIPHSGENVPPEFREYLSGDESAYREDVDFKVNELVDIPTLQKNGIAVVVSNIHRICVDLNRAEENCVLFWKENTMGKKLVVKEPTPEAVKKFIEDYHRPYYEILKTALLELEKRKEGKVSMIDLHSMPSRPTAYHMKQNPNQSTWRPDFCLSDRRGKTCDPDFIQYFRDIFTILNHSASMNDPYIGGFVTEYVDRYRTNNIQIEINRSIYMDESKKELVTSKVQSLRPLLTQVLVDGFTKFDS
ncbi:MAG: N-formylglutamate amidohydrolase [Bacteriovoracaceae bacterium]